MPARRLAGTAVDATEPVTQTSCTSSSTSATRCRSASTRPGTSAAGRPDQRPLRRRRRAHAAPGVVGRPFCRSSTSTARKTARSSPSGSGVRVPRLLGHRPRHQRRGQRRPRLAVRLQRAHRPDDGRDRRRPGAVGRRQDDPRTGDYAAANMRMFNQALAKATPATPASRSTRGPTSRPTTGSSATASTTHRAAPPTAPP
jgi:hypothetical protein